MEQDPKGTHQSTPKAQGLAFFRDYAGEDRIVNISELRQILSARTAPEVSFKTGFYRLDELVGGVRGGELIVVGGKTKNGKTTFCQTLTDNFHRQGIKSLWFEYEVPVRQFAEQFELSTDLCVPLLLGKNDIFWLTNKVFEAIVKHEIKAVFIDHLHYLIDLTRMRNPSLEIGAIVRQLKLMAVAFEVAVFLVCHVRDVLAGEEVTEAHLRDSKMTAAEADSTWIVSRLLDKKTEEATNLCKLSVRNHRRTGVMARSFKMVKTGKYFEQWVDECDSIPEESCKPSKSKKHAPTETESANYNSQIF